MGMSRDEMTRRLDRVISCIEGEWNEADEERVLKEAVLAKLDELEEVAEHRRQLLEELEALWQSSDSATRWVDQMGHLQQVENRIRQEIGGE